MNWSEKPLEEVADFSLGKMLDQKKNRGEFMPYLANVNVRWGEFNFENLREMRFEPGELDRFCLKYGDIVMCEGGEPGRCAIWKDQVPGMMIQKALHRIRPHPCLDNRFLFYSFLKKGRNEELSGLFTGSTIKHLPREKLAKVRFDIPPLPIQQRIADILSTYDDLIENNRRRITLLEKAARLLYREWFVHFRFPGHKDVKIIKGIPEGWKRVRIGNVLIAIESGGRPRGGALGSDGIPSIGAENVIGLGQYNYLKEKFVPEDYFAKMRRGVIQSRDVVLYKDGAHIGRSSMFGDAFPHCQCAVNEHVFILRAEADIGQSYLYFWLAQPETRQSIVNLNANTAQPGISQGKLKTLWFLLPPEVLGNRFNESVETQVAQIFRLALMNQKLAEARDLLLPRLMNGEIAV